LPIFLLFKDFVTLSVDVSIFSLLAMGVDQFGHLPNKYVFVREFLVPNKTLSQLTFRFKNLKSSRMRSENAAKVFNSISIIQFVNGAVIHQWK